MKLFLKNSKVYIFDKNKDTDKTKVEKFQLEHGRFIKLQ